MNNRRNQIDREINEIDEVIRGIDSDLAELASESVSLSAGGAADRVIEGVGGVLAVLGFVSLAALNPLVALGLGCTGAGLFVAQVARDRDREVITRRITARVRSLNAEKSRLDDLKRALVAERNRLP